MVESSSEMRWDQPLLKARPLKPPEDLRYSVRVAQRAMRRASRATATDARKRRKGRGPPRKSSPRELVQKKRAGKEGHGPGLPEQTNPKKSRGQDVGARGYG
eukprot:8867847-Alexandrium_andersonii.AAC.1